MPKKIKDLIEYYKYHSEIPRVYMLPISLICNCKYIIINSIFVKITYLITLLISIVKNIKILLIIITIIDYHDKKRRINYYKIKVLLH